MLEAQLEGRLRRGVRRLGGMSVKLIAAESGVPDRLVLLPGGRMFLVELKTETGALRPDQRVWHSRALAKCGITVHIVVGPDGVDAWLNDQKELP